MDTVFISHAQADLAAVDPIGTGLNAAGIALSQNPQRQPAGQRSQVGEAIAAQQGFLLCWSKAAAAAQDVKLEWNIALALRKPILICRLDGTVLPPRLGSLPMVDFRLADGLAQILAGLQALPEAPGAAANTQAVLALAAQPGPPDAIIRQLSYQQDAWEIQGNVYQASGDIHINASPTPPPHESKLAAWSLRVGLIVALLTGLGLFLDLPGKARQALQALNIAPSAEQSLSGVVWDERNQPVAGAQVSIIETGQTITTGPTGAFHFKLDGEKGPSLRVQAQKPGYVSVPQFVSAGAKVDLTLRRAK